MNEELWDGIVLDVWPDGDTFTAELRREDEPDLLAEFSMRECGVTVVSGDLLIIRPDSVVKRDLGVWTREEIDEIKRRAAIRFAQLRNLFDPPLEKD